MYGRKRTFCSFVCMNIFNRICFFMIFFFIVLILPGQPSGEPPVDRRFIKHVITADFISEGVTVADVNNDGKPDIIAGAYWFEAPNWTRHEIAQPQHFSPSDGYSNSFLN